MSEDGITASLCVLVCLLQEGEEKVRGLISHQIECRAR